MTLSCQTKAPPCRCFNSRRVVVCTQQGSKSVSCDSKAIAVLSSVAVIVRRKLLTVPRKGLYACWIQTLLPMGSWWRLGQHCSHGQLCGTSHDQTIPQGC